MSIFLRWFRRLLVWLGPALVLLVAVASGFLFWTVRSESGTRWVMNTVVDQLGGQVQGIRGTLWKGVSIQSLDLDMPGFSLALEGAHFQAVWPDLMQRRLHIVDVSAHAIDLDLRTTNEPEPGPDTGSFRMPALPVSVAIDRVEVGRFVLHQDGKLVPVDVQDLHTAISVSQDGAQMLVKHVTLAAQSVQAKLDGDVRLLALNKPWPLEGHLALTLQGQGKDSPLCVHRYVPSLPAGSKAAASADTCSATVDVAAKGDIDQLDVSLTGRGQSLNLKAQARLAPSAAFPVRSASVGLDLADGSSLHGKFDWVTTLLDGVVHDDVKGSVRMHQLDIGALAGKTIPPAVVTATLNVDARLQDHHIVRGADLDLSFDKNSRWNGQSLSGHLAATVSSSAAPTPVSARASASTPVQTPDTASAPAPTFSPLPPLWQSIRLDSLDMDLVLGPNHMKAKGALGAAKSRLDLNVQAPSLAAFWPELSGKAAIDGYVGGAVASHRAQLNLSYAPGPGEKAKQPPAPVQARVALTGQWGAVIVDDQPHQGWRGTVSTLQLDYDGLGARILAPLKASFVVDAQTGQWQWQAGAVDVAASLPLGKSFVLHNKASRGGPGWWSTQGAIPTMTVSRRLITALQKKFAPQPPHSEKSTGSVHVQGQPRKHDTELVFSADWNLAYKGTLTGKAHIQRLSGDLMVPGQPSFPLGLQGLSLDLSATPKGDAASVLGASVTITTAKMGRLRADGSAVIKTAGPNAWTLDTGSAQTLRVQADIADLSWVNLFLGDETEVGGALTVDVKASSASGGSWKASGNIRGKDIKFVRVDDGVRLFNGTLSAHLDGTRLILDSLRFPAELRVKPKEWRTATWVSTNPDAKNGNLTLTGHWDLLTSQGNIEAKLYRYPILQRSDRYAMLSGTLTVNAQLPVISIVGDVKADAGWFNLDVLGSVPSVDGDVVIIRPGQEKTVQVPSQITLDLKVDLGPRFYLTGYGVNSGLIGSMHILMSGNRLTGVGELNTRGGSIDIYGQHLQLRRGKVTFQGNIANPVLNIEALRTGVAVQAGVHVGGTARRPKIDLVSYPDVSEAEKLSWLLLGRAPDAGGGDMALLLSVGTSILGGGEPLYRKLGLDELGIRTGELGSTGSILPPESVVSGLSNNPSELEQQFAMAGKHFSNGVTLSLEQALASTGTVGRASYRLSRRLRTEFSVGTVNGIALIYHVFFDH